MEAQRVIRIAVRAADVVPRSRLKIIQDVDEFSLKTLTEERYLQLRGEIVEKGFSFAIHVWDDGTDLNVLDGTQRLRVVDRMVEKEGWTCEGLPIAYVEAGSLKEAVLKLLGGASSYGDPNDEGLYALMMKFDIKLPEIQNIALPRISLPAFADNFFNDPHRGGGSPEQDAAEEESVPEPKAEAFCKRGDVWKLGRHRIMCGDSTLKEDIQHLVHGETIDLVLTDPPYGVDYEGIANDHHKGEELRAFIRSVLQEINPFVRDGACYYIWHGDIHAYEFTGAIRDVGWKQASPATIQWVKDSLVLSRGDYHPQHEPCLYGWKPGAGHKRVEDRTESTIWECPKPRKAEGHPTMKPLALIERALKNSSETDWVVCDPFLGSGSTLIGCERMNRKCIGLELDPAYCDVIIQRWQKITGQSAVREDGALFPVSP